MKRLIATLSYVQHSLQWHQRGLVTVDMAVMVVMAVGTTEGVMLWLVTVVVMAGIDTEAGFWCNRDWLIRTLLLQTSPSPSSLCMHGVE